MKTMVMTKEKSNEKSSWLDMRIACKESRRRLDKSIDNLAAKNDKTIHDIVDLSVEREMRRDVAEAQRTIEQKLLYELNTLNLEDIRNAKLTKKEVEVATLRQKKSVKEIANELNLDSSVVFRIYKSALSKIESYKTKNDNEKILNILSPQQRAILELMKKGKNLSQISKELGTTSSNIRKQKSMINKKIDVTKILQ